MLCFCCLAQCSISLNVQRQLSSCICLPIVSYPFLSFILYTLWNTGPSCAVVRWEESCFFHWPLHCCVPLDLAHSHFSNASIKWMQRHKVLRSPIEHNFNLKLYKIQQPDSGDNICWLFLKFTSFNFTLSTIFDERKSINAPAASLHPTTWQRWVSGYKASKPVMVIHAGSQQPVTVATSSWWPDADPAAHYQAASSLTGNQHRSFKDDIFDARARKTEPLEPSGALRHGLFEQSEFMVHRHLIEHCIQVTAIQSLWGLVTSTINVLFELPTTV